MPLLVLDIYNTLLMAKKNNDSSEFPYSIDPAVVPLLKQFKENGWTIVTLDNHFKPNSEWAAIYRKELKNIGLDETVISFHYPSGYQSHDTKMMMLERYLKQFSMQKDRGNVYFFDNDELFIKQAQEKLGFSLTQVFHVTPDLPLAAALAEAYQRKIAPAAVFYSEPPIPRFNTGFYYSNPDAERASLLKTTPQEIIPYLLIAPITLGDPALTFLINKVKNKSKNPEVNLETAILRVSNLQMDYKLEQNLSRIPSDYFQHIMIEKDDELYQYFESTFDFINKAYQQRIPVLLQCDHLHNPHHAACIAAAFLMKKFRLTADEACHHIRHQRPHTLFSSIAIDQLNQYQTALGISRPVRERSSLIITIKHFLKKHWKKILVGSFITAAALTLTVVSMGFLAPVAFAILTGWAASTFAVLGGIPFAIAVGELAALTIGALLGGVAGKIWDVIKKQEALPPAPKSPNAFNTEQIHQEIGSLPPDNQDKLEKRNGKGKGKGKGKETHQPGINHTGPNIDHNAEAEQKPGTNHLRSSLDDDNEEQEEEILTPRRKPPGSSLFSPPEHSEGQDKFSNGVKSEHNSSLRSDRAT